MEAKKMKVADLVPYENNPRINEDAVDAVAESISQFGWQQPIIVNKNNVIISGHTRYEAAKKLGLEDVPVVIAADMNEAQENAFRIADNKTAELAEWDYDKLRDELNDLAESGGEAFTAFTEEEIRQIALVDEPEVNKQQNKSESGSGSDGEEKEIVCPRCGYEMKPEDLDGN